jgi:ABC-type nitrate/sulfonate/bicarbonate transport system permease component
MSGRSIMLKFAALLFAAGVIWAWQLLADARVISPVFFPSPTRTFAALSAMEARGDLWKPMAATALRMFYGWVLASLAGVLLGAAIARSGPVRAYLEPLLEFLRPLPASAIIPPAILFLGLTSKMAVAVISFGALWPVLLGAYHGFRSVDPQLLEMATALRMGAGAFLWKVALPSALPDIFSGVRVSLAIALILAVVTEMQSAQSGLGFNILMAQRSFRSPELYAGIVVLGVLGLLTNQALVLGERRLLRWRLVTR